MTYSIESVAYLILANSSFTFEIDWIPYIVVGFEFMSRDSSFSLFCHYTIYLHYPKPDFEKSVSQVYPSVDAISSKKIKIENHIIKLIRYCYCTSSYNRLKSDRTCTEKTELPCLQGPKL